MTRALILGVACLAIEIGDALLRFRIGEAAGGVLQAGDADRDRSQPLADIVVQIPRLVLGITQRAVVLERGRIVHEAASAALLADSARLESLLAVAAGS